ncbi:AIM24 family protein [Rudaeicoccus suwonensis]|uniref:Uncharacterized protein (AIM24 family) n=1 Tax=Rudaeicoccus suwonensis TaxID=657409 RepID=A0A561E6P7_9MICO|nr:AIM24 family protein [Rudaeicoccus suwonensis]TWE11298.1 uncharacterized protein (AIM24 family) [Rudaeicoccus suwonensis]
MTTTAPATYVCPYCRVTTDGMDRTCPHCGAPVDVALRRTSGGWIEQPPIRDMARLQFNRSTCQISGSYVPVAEMRLDQADSVYFSHHVLLHADPQVALEAMKMSGGWNRMMAGMPLIMMTAKGPGFVAFSHQHPGETLAIPLQHGQAVDVAEHKFLVGTTNISYGWHDPNVWYETADSDGKDQEIHRPIGYSIDRFTAQEGPGLLLLHAPGNVMVRDLAVGEKVLIQPSAFIWKDPKVNLFLHFEYPGGTTWFSNNARWESKNVWLKLSGPGRVAMSSVFERPEVVGRVRRSSPASNRRW